MGSTRSRRAGAPIPRSAGARRRATTSAGDAELARDLAIDLGTASTLVYARGEGIVLHEPSVLAVDPRRNEVLAFGAAALALLADGGRDVVAVRPLRQGAISDFDLVQRLLRLLLEQVGASRLARPRVVLCIPSAMPPIERRALADATRRAGAAEAVLLPQSTAAAIGAGLPVHEPVGTLVVDIGGGTTEVALLSLGSAVASASARVGGFDLDAAIQTHVRREHGMSIGERTAEDVRRLIGSAWPTEEEHSVEVRGRELVRGAARAVVLTAPEVRVAMEEPLTTMIETVRACLADTPAELAPDVLTSGGRLVGGGALLAGMAPRFAHEIDLPFAVVDAAAEVAILGAGRCIENYEEIKDVFL